MFRDIRLPLLMDLITGCGPENSSNNRGSARHNDIIRSQLKIFYYPLHETPVPCRLNTPFASACSTTIRSGIWSGNLQLYRRSRPDVRSAEFEASGHRFL